MDENCGELFFCSFAASLGVDLTIPLLAAGDTVKRRLTTGGTVSAMGIPGGILDGESTSSGYRRLLLGEVWSGSMRVVVGNIAQRGIGGGGFFGADVWSSGLSIASTSRGRSEYKCAGSFGTMFDKFVAGTFVLSLGASLAEPGGVGNTLGVLLNFLTGALIVEF